MNTTTTHNPTSVRFAAQADIEAGSRIRSEALRDFIFVLAKLPLTLVRSVKANLYGHSASRIEATSR